MTSQKVKLRGFLPSLDTERLHGWLQRPHVKQWWTTQTVKDLVARDSDAHAVIEVDEKPVGYICWEFPSPHDLEAAGLTDLPAGLMDIDIFIGEQKMLGQGIGVDALGLLLDSLRSRSDVQYAGLATSVENHFAKRAFEKAGFKVFREFDDPESGRCYYLVRKIGNSGWMDN